jgi:predicted ATPase/DNA-binding winged helix-turn-helix (wHTH) protein
VSSGLNFVYTAGRWQVDLHRRELRADGLLVPIGMRAFEIIEVLVKSAGTLVAKDDLMRAVWPGAIVEEATLWVHISAIRRALGPDRLMLRTVSRRGYRLIGNWAATPHDTSPSDAGVVGVDRRAPQPLTNIPETPHDLIGRTTSIQRLLDLSSAYRAITLTGPGGIGKTVLALEVARRLLPRFNGNGWFIDLSSLSDEGLLASAVAATIGLRLGGDAITPQTVGRAIGQTKLLLVLDNCEHVIEAASSLAEVIVRFCPHVSMLSTSRETLQIGGEYVYRVPTLTTPSGGNQEPGTILGYSAVQLFIARTKVLWSDFSPDDAALSRIASICERLDGIPLAVEFASACAAAIGLQEIEDRLADRFGLLTGGRRTAPPRHQTLAATLEWSYHLLPEWERLLLRHLAVFRGGFTLDAAISVVGSGLATPSDVVKGVRNLITKSLVATEGPSAVDRLRLLETTRAYAARELDAKGETQSARKNHAQYFRDLLARAAAGSQAPRSIPPIIEHGREIDNIRAALEWAFSPAGDPAVGVTLTAMYAPVWLYLSLLQETKERVEHALTNLGSQTDSPLVIRMKLQIALGLALIFTMGPMTRIRSAITFALRAARQLDDEGTELQALWALWILDTGIEEIYAGRSTVEQFEHLARRVGDPGLVAFADRLAGYTLHLAGEHKDAERRFRQVIDAPSVPTGQRYTILNYDHRAVSRAGLAATLCLQGFVDQAVDESQASLREALTSRHLVSTCEVIRLAAFPIAVMIQDFAAAEKAIAMLVDVATSQNGTYWIILGQFLKGELAVRHDEFAQGVALLRNAFGLCRENGWASRYSQFLAVLAEGLAGLGRLNEALSTVDTALARAQRGGELVYAPEILRTKGELALKEGLPGSAAAAECCFLEAIDMAKQQGALLWELRATLSLARLKAQHGRREEARSELSLIYDRFTEGFGSGDLCAARSLLCELLADDETVRVVPSSGRSRHRS